MREYQKAAEKFSSYIGEIEARAWDICLQRGEDEPALEDWLTAEQELLRECDQGIRP